MGVYIKGMEMPKSCGSCFVGNRTICSDGCPLVPVPPHRRLIDADEFEKQNAYFWNRDFINPKYSETLADLVNAAPTIIEAGGRET